MELTQYKVDDKILVREGKFYDTYTVVAVQREGVFAVTEDGTYVMLKPKGKKWRVQGRPKALVQPPLFTTLTGVREIDMNILLQVPDALELLEVCKVNNYIASICNDALFWQTKVIRDYSREIMELKDPSISYKEQYRRLYVSGRDLRIAFGQQYADAIYYYLKLDPDTLRRDERRVELSEAHFNLLFKGPPEKVIPILNFLYKEGLIFKDSSSRASRVLNQQVFEIMQKEAIKRDEPIFLEWLVANDFLDISDPGNLVTEAYLNLSVKVLEFLGYDPTEVDPELENLSYLVIRRAISEKRSAADIRYLIRRNTTLEPDLLVSALQNFYSMDVIDTLLEAGVRLPSDFSSSEILIGMNLTPDSLAAVKKALRASGLTFDEASIILVDSINPELSPLLND